METGACTALNKPPPVCGPRLPYLLSFSLHAVSQQGLLVLQLPLQIHLGRGSRGVTTDWASQASSQCSPALPTCW